MCLDLGLSKSTMSEMKAGRTKGISTTTAQKIASYFGVTIGYLLGEEEKEKKPADEGELGKDMFVWHRNGEDGQVKLSDETYEAIINLIKTFSEKPKDI